MGVCGDGECVGLYMGGFLLPLPLVLWECSPGELDWGGVERIEMDVGKL